MSQKSEISRREKLAYGIGDVGNAIATSSCAFYLLFYLTDVAHLSGTLAGVALMIGRIWDAFADPIVGWTVDHTKSRWGKRRPYLLFGAPIFALSFFSMWVMPDFPSESARFFYILIACLIFNTALAFVFIPYTSLTAAITTSYDERASLTGYRMVCSQAATLLGGVLPPILATWVVSESARAVLDPINPLFGEWAGTKRQGFFIMGAIFGALMLGSLWVTFFGTKERVEATGESHVANPFRYTLSLIQVAKENIAFRTSLMIKLLSTCATTMIAANIPYYISHVLEMETSKPLILGVLFISAILFTPIWVILARNHGKAECYRVAAVGYIFVLACIPILGSGPTSLIYPLSIAAGFFHSAALMIPWSIIPDVVESDELMSGQRRDGLLYGGTAFAYKFASAFAIFLVGVVLDLVGYDSTAARTTLSVWGIILLFALGPGILFGISYFASKAYPITAARHRELLAQLAERKKAASN